MKPTVLIPALILVAVIAVCGCTGTQTQTAATTATAVSATQAEQTTTSLIAGRTDVMPENIAVSVTVSEKDDLGQIPVTFDGGKGQINVKRIDVTLTRYDGSVSTTTLGMNKWDEVVLEGTRGEGSNKGQPDRIEVTVVMNNGISYKIVDTTREYRSRG